MFFILTTAFAFAYWLLMFLLISFITLSYIHFTIQGIFALAILGTVIVDIFYVRRKIRQRRYERRERKLSGGIVRLQNAAWLNPEKASQDGVVVEETDEEALEEVLEQEEEIAADALVGEAIEKAGKAR